MRWLLPRVRGDALPLHAAQRRRTRVSADTRSLYELQRGRCYYCGKVLGPLGTAGAFVRDHLSPVSGFRYSAASSLNRIDNIALTCHGCNEDKSGMDENAYWQLLRKRRGKSWVGRRQASMDRVRRWRDAESQDRIRRQEEAEMAHLDAIVEADYQAKLAKRLKR